MIKSVSNIVCLEMQMSATYRMFATNGCKAHWFYNVPGYNALWTTKKNLKFQFEQENNSWHE